MIIRDGTSNFIAFHLNSTEIIRSFVKTAARLFSHDNEISKKILKLCIHRDSSVREVAFISISRTSLFRRHFKEVKSMFLSDANEGIRKRLILESATYLSSSHVLAINREGSSRDVTYHSILDFSELLDEDKVSEVIASQSHRASQQSNREIRERQQEVLAMSPFFASLLFLDNVEWLLDAIQRVDTRKSGFERYLEGKIDNAFKRQN